MHLPSLSIMKKYSIFLILFGSVIIITIAFLTYSRVDNKITLDDLRYGEKIINRRLSSLMIDDYTDEIAFIRHVQQGVLNTAKINKSIPYKTEREPKNLFQLKYGLCYDRSRVIEKILAAAGFKTRHVTVFKNPEQMPPILKIMDPRRHASHAVTEVLTRNGWLTVDSNQPFIAVDVDFHPYSIKKIRQYAVTGKTIRWADPYREFFDPVFKKDFIYIYGLYSRHGNFYPPYNGFPDINWNEFYQNFTELINSPFFSDHTEHPVSGSGEYPESS